MNILQYIFIKLLFYKLSETSYRSMAKMKNLQPKIVLLKERYGDDKQKLAQATMKLYKEAKANPLGGCLPFLVQIPFFISLYFFFRYIFHNLIPPLMGGVLLVVYSLLGVSLLSLSFQLACCLP